MGSLLIVDFMYLYYKYIYSYNSGKMKRFYWGGNISHNCREHTDEGISNWDVPCSKCSYARQNYASQLKTSAYKVLEVCPHHVDTTMVYKPISEIINTAKKMGPDTAVVVCFDSKSMKKDNEEFGEYKAKRKKTLTDRDYQLIKYTEGLLDCAGVETLKFEGYEADDIIFSVVCQYLNKYSEIKIMTADNDMLQLVCDKVSINLYKAGNKIPYTNVSMGNVTGMLSNMYNAEIPYGAYPLYKATVGDSSDNIKGITGFGNSGWGELLAFAHYKHNLIDELTFDKNSRAYKNKTAEVIKMLFKGEEQEQALLSLKQAAFIELPIDLKGRIPTEESRMVFLQLGMKSLV